MKNIIIQGSSNPKGNTNAVVQILKDRIDAKVLDLSALQIAPFDYQFENQTDDFNSVIHDVLDQFDNLIFATPVYWYTMSGILKNFFDRFTDGLLHDKALGKKFEGKGMGVLACGSSKEPIEGYFIPFEKSAVYLKMNYLGNVHLWVDEQQKMNTQALRRLDSFSLLFQLVADAC